jgi:type I restriction enzyme S subunit
MKAKTIPSTWLERDGRRLDCGPYMSGALEAKALLDVCGYRLQALSQVTARIFGIPVFPRIDVEGAREGLPLLGNTDILAADLSHVRRVSKRTLALSPNCLVREGMILLTSFGTPGYLAWARGDMEGAVGSNNFMRIVPDESKLPGGYLYAFLCTKFGVPLLLQRTSGSVVRYLLPQHIADLPVPRLGKELEQQAHNLVQRAASLRVEASRRLRDAAARFDSLLDGIDLSTQSESPRISLVNASAIQRRFDAQFHDPLVRAVRERLASNQHVAIGEWCNRVFLPGIFKRIHTDDVAYGAPYYTGATLFWLEPQPKGVLSRKTTLFEDVRMEEGTVLVQAFGQEGGLTGRAVWVGRHLAGSTTTHMLVRLRAETREDTAYLFGFLQSDAAYRQIASLTYGGSIPHFDEAGIASVVLPLLSPKERREIAQQVLTAVSNRDDALDAEHKARALIEDAIEKGAN